VWTDSVIGGGEQERRQYATVKRLRTKRGFSSSSLQRSTDCARGERLAMMAERISDRRVLKQPGYVRADDTDGMP